jgi:hypothetical protein
MVLSGGPDRNARAASERASPEAEIDNRAAARGYSPAVATMMTPTARKILIPLLLVLGVQIWVSLDESPNVIGLLIAAVRGDFRPWQLLHAVRDSDQMWVLAAAVLLTAIPPVRHFFFRLIQRVRHVTPRMRAITTAGVFVVSTAYLIFTALHQGRPLFPKYHDNQSYAVQAQIIASGHLWLEKHAHPEFFDTFHVLVEPVYASMYFPGAAMFFAVGVLLHLPFWITAILIAAGCMALVYRVISEIVDNFAGLLAPLWLVSLPWFRHLSAMLMSHPVLLLLGLAMVWAFLRWREHKKLRWCLAIGAFAGFAAITRPADALCYALPVGIAMLLDLRKHRLADFFRVGATIVAGAVPFLALQIVFNLGVSGKPFESPYRTYLDRDAPQLSFGFHTYDPEKLPKSPLPQKQIYQATFNASLIRDHRPDRLFNTWFDRSDGRLRTVFESTMPSLILAPWVLVGFLGLTTRPRWTLFMTLPLYCLLYLFYAALLRHYTPVIAPATILLGLLGIREIESCHPRLRAAATFSAVFMVGICILVLPEVNPRMADDPFPYPEMRDARINIPREVQRPALVFVTFSPTFRENERHQMVVEENVHSEPVYNYEAARIDDNPIIFAHDLGPKNVELLRYYLEKDPGRHVYTYHRLTRRLMPRGTIADELKRLTSPAATTQAATSPTSAP